MEFLQELTGMRITAYSSYAAAAFFVLGCVELIILKLVFSRRKMVSGQYSNGTVVIDRGNGSDGFPGRGFWMILIIFSLVLFPIMGFLFFGDMFEMIKLLLFKGYYA